MTVTWVPVPGGMGLTYGSIPAITDLFDRELCCVGGEIRLPLGNIAHGSIHLNAPKRRERFAPLTPEQFVYQVTSAFDEIWVQRGRNTLFLIRDGHSPRKTTTISISLVDGCYSVITAFPITRDHNSKRRKEVCIWRR